MSHLPLGDSKGTTCTLPPLHCCARMLPCTPLHHPGQAWRSDEQTPTHRSAWTRDHALSLVNFNISKQGDGSCEPSPCYLSWSPSLPANLITGLWWLWLPLPTAWADSSPTFTPFERRPQKISWKKSFPPPKKSWEQRFEWNAIAIDRKS